MTPHVAKKRRNAIEGRTTSHGGYRGLPTPAQGGVGTFRVDEKDTGGLRKLVHQGLEKIEAIFTLTCTAFNLRRLSKLLAEAPLRAATTSG